MIAALLEGYDPLAQRGDDLGVVGRHEDRHAELVDPEEELEDLPADQRVEVPGWLVGDDEARVVDERAGDRRALLLAPDSVLGSWRAWADRPTSASTRSTAGAISRPGVPVTSSANATFSQTVFVGRSLKSWKMIPIFRRIRGTWRRPSRARSWPSRITTPWVASRRGSAAGSGWTCRRRTVPRGRRSSSPRARPALQVKLLRKLL